MKLVDHLYQHHFLPPIDRTNATSEQLKKFHDEAHSSGRVGSVQSKSLNHMHNNGAIVVRPHYDE